MDEFQYLQYTAFQRNEAKEKESEAALLERVHKFAKIDSLEMAKELAKSIIPTNQEITHFNVGNIKCIIVNRKNLFRISLDSDKEFVCYSFDNNEENKYE